MPSPVDVIELQTWTMQTWGHDEDIRKTIGAVAWENCGYESKYCAVGITKQFASVEKLHPHMTYPTLSDIYIYIYTQNHESEFYSIAVLFVVSYDNNGCFPSVVPMTIQGTVDSIRRHTACKRICKSKASTYLRSTTVTWKSVSISGLHSKYWWIQKHGCYTLKCQKFQDVNLAD